MYIQYTIYFLYLLLVYYFSPEIIETRSNYGQQMSCILDINNQKRILCE